MHLLQEFLLLYYSVVLIANFRLTHYIHLIILKLKMHAILVQKITISV